MACFTEFNLILLKINLSISRNKSQTLLTIPLSIDMNHARFEGHTKLLSKKFFVSNSLNWVSEISAKNFLLLKCDKLPYFQGQTDRKSTSNRKTSKAEQLVKPVTCKTGILLNGFTLKAIERFGW